MVYVVIDIEDVFKATLVRAENEKEVTDRLRLGDTERIIASFTSFDVKALDTTRFTVIDS